MALITKTTDQIKKFTDEELLEMVNQAPESEPDEFLPDDPKAWANINFDELVGKKDIHIKLDWDIIHFFKERAKNQNTRYQTDINRVLKGYVAAQRKTNRQKTVN